MSCRRVSRGRMSRARNGLLTGAIRRHRFMEESELSPRSRPPSRSPNTQDRSDIAPWDDGPSDNTDSPVANGIPVRRPSDTEDFPQPNWGSLPRSNGELSPGSSPFPTYMQTMSPPSNGAIGDDRRPSMASNTTVGSDSSSRTNSKSLHKIQSFFGDDPNEPQSRIQPPHASDQKRPNFPRQLSVNSAFSANKKSRQPSPDSSRPRSPLPGSSDVTPWEFQDNEVNLIFPVSSDSTSQPGGEITKRTLRLALQRWLIYRDFHIFSLDTRQH